MMMMMVVMMMMMMMMMMINLPLYCAGMISNSVCHVKRDHSSALFCKYLSHEQECIVVSKEVNIEFSLKA